MEKEDPSNKYTLTTFYPLSNVALSKEETGWEETEKAAPQPELQEWNA